MSKQYTISKEIKQYPTSKYNAVVVTEGLQIVVVFNEGFKTDYITVYSYENVEYGTNFGHSPTTHKLIKRAIRWVYKNHMQEKD